MFGVAILIQLTLPQIRFSFVEGAPFHENDENVDKQASGPHTNTLGRQTKSPIPLMDFDPDDIYLTNPYDLLSKGQVFKIMKHIHETSALV